MRVEEYPDLDDLEQRIVNGFERTKNQIKEDTEGGVGVIEDLFLENIVVIGEWGHGTAEKGEDPLTAILFVDIENKSDYGIIEDLSENDLFANLSNELADRYIANVEASDQMEEWFAGADFGVIGSNLYEDYISVFVEQAQPNRVFDLTRRAIATPGPRGPEFEPVEQQRETEIESTGGDDILDYPDLNEITGVLNDAFETARDIELEQASAAQKEIFENIFIDTYVVVGSWGNGTAVRGEDTLQVMASMNIQGETPTMVTFFDTASTNLAEQMEQVVEPTERMSEWFGGVSINSEASNFFDEGTEIRLDSLEPPRSVDITNRNILTLEDGELEITGLATEEEEPTPEPEVDEEASEIEELAEKFPEVPTELLFYAAEKGGQIVAEIPAGKETKAVTPRKPLQFEQEMFNPDSTELDDVNYGIGEAIASQRFGTEEPAATFPRTGNYIRNFLLHQGPSYVLEMYNNLVVYSGYISAMYDGRFRPGKYVSFRKMILNINNYSRHPEGEKLIRRLSDSEAKERGLDIRPTLPSGDPAPWLESRQYYEIVEDNKDSRAWVNVTDALAEINEKD